MPRVGKLIAPMTETAFLKVRDCRVSQLNRAEARRVPLDPRQPLVGYHVCCPECGYVTVALHDQGGLAIDEDDTGGVTFRGLRCVFCCSKLDSVNSAVTMRRDANYRQISYKP